MNLKPAYFVSACNEISVIRPKASHTFDEKETFHTCQRFEGAKDSIRPHKNAVHDRTSNRGVPASVMRK